MSSLKRHEGYLLVDHSASPGLPEDVARMMGYDPALCREGKVFEAATLTCKHCGNAWNKNPFRTRAREYCRLCDHYICDGCHELRSRPDYVHTTRDKLRDDALELGHLMEQLGVEEMLGSPPGLLQSTTANP